MSKLKTWLWERLKMLELWGHALSAWFKEARHVWFAIIVSLCASIWVFYNPTDLNARCTSMVLQLLGIGTIVLDFLKKFIKSFSRLPIPGRQNRSVTLTAKGMLAGVTAFGRARVTVQQQSVEGRISNIEGSVEDIYKQIENLEKNTKNNEEKIDQETIVRTTADEKILERLVQSESRNLSLAAGGSLLIAVGVVLSSLAGEIVAWLK